MEKAIISEKQLQESLQQQKEKNKLLGEILLEAGYITDEQLEYALSIQRENKKKKLGQVLVELQYITPNDICIALATQFHCPWIDLSQVKIPLETASSLPEEVVRRLEVIPVEKKKNGNILVVATSQPQDPSVGLEVSKHTPLKVELVVAYEGDIDAAINSFYPR
jgi:type IV pilus assembly protein PilB